MELKARLQVDFKPIDELEAFTEGFDALAIEIGQQVFNEIAPQLRSELAFVPSRVAYPIQWTSEKQRGYYFAVVAMYNPQTGEIIPYRETGQRQIVKNWRVTGRATRGRYTMLAQNRNPKARFVYGDIDFRRSAGPYPPQQQFHANTGWVPAQKTISFWFNEYNTVYNERFERELGRFGFTSTRRRDR